MDSGTTMQLGIWLAEKKNQPWVRGKNDCCTFMMEWHDYIHGTKTLDQIYGKYYNLKTAIQWAKKVPLNKWFTEHGYKVVDKPQTGDIVMVKHNKFFYSNYIVCLNVAWGLQDDAKGFSRHPLETMQEHTIWRHISWA